MKKIKLDNIKINTDANIEKYRNEILDVYWNKKYGFSTDKWMFEGQSKVEHILFKARKDKNISAFELWDFLDELKENGVI